jgi:hypothetical protein
MGRAGARTERQNSLRVRQAHELAGSIALKEKRWDDALAELAQYATRAADAHVLPVAAYAFIRKEARAMSQP